MSITRRNSSGVSRVAGTAVPTPALLISTSTLPSSSTVSATTRLQSSGLATSAWTATHRRPRSWTWVLVCSSYSTRRAQIAMSAPASARPTANATPSPEDAPVTMATFPASEKESRTLLIAGADYNGGPVLVAVLLAAPGGLDGRHYRVSRISERDEFAEWLCGVLGAGTGEVEG